MDLNEKAKEIRKIIEQKQKELELTFIEDKHIYYMKDTNGKIRNDYMSVSKLIKKFHKPFDAEGKSLQMCNGDPIEAKKLQEQWKMAGDYSTNMGSRVHFLLENDLVKQYGDYKEVRQPIFNCDQLQIDKSDAMVRAGKEFLNLMHERGAVLLDTEMVLGDPELKYTGQPDKFWLMMNKDKTDFGLVTTDWKGLPIDTPIFTNNGWKTMGTLNINDKVFDKDGKLVNIKHISKIKNVKCLKIKFDNNEDIISDYQHRWLVFVNHNKIKKEIILTTEEIKEYYKKYKNLKSYKILKIRNCEPLKNSHQNLPIDPYVFGIWLGDGHSSCSMITQENEKVWDEIKKRGYILGDDVSAGRAGKAKTRNVFGIRKNLRKLNLINNKHLPDNYILSSFEQRLDILRGLMDSDGYYNKKRNRYIISTTRESQIEFSKILISSLGLKPTIIKYNKKLNGKIIKCFNIEFTTDKFNPFLCRNQDMKIKLKSDRNSYRRIVSINEVESVPTICIEVDSLSSTYLFGKTFITTHNTNQEKNFQVQWYNGYLLTPFNDLRDYALTHYYLQLPFYARLLLKMLKGSKYEDLRLLGCVIVHLKDDGTFTEYKVPTEVNKKVFSLNINKYTNG